MNYCTRHFIMVSEMEIWLDKGSMPLWICQTIKHFCMPKHVWQYCTFSYLLIVLTLRSLNSIYCSIVRNHERGLFQTIYYPLRHDKDSIKQPSNKMAQFIRSIKDFYTKISKHCGSWLFRKIMVVNDIQKKWVPC